MCIKKTLPFEILYYLQAIVLIWQLWILRTNDPQKHKILYTWQLYDVIINFQCVKDLLFLRIINSKQSPQLTIISAVKKTNKTKGKYKEKQRALLKVWLIYSCNLATMECAPKVPFWNHSIVIKRALFCLWELKLGFKT